MLLVKHDDWHWRVDPRFYVECGALFSVDAGFIGKFKLGDNINHNLRILAYLYHCQSDPNDTESWVLRKPIIILIGAVCEALLHDLHERMNTHTVEGVTGVAASVLTYVRGKKIDKFEKYVASAKKHSLLGAPSENIYEDLEELRKLRNRVHIQNDKNHFEPDDSQAFTLERQVKSEITLETLAKILSEKHPRQASAQGFVADFKFPWNEHLP